MDFWKKDVFKKIRIFKMLRPQFERDFSTCFIHDAFTISIQYSRHFHDIALHLKPLK
jgi:hypothetical protein